MRVPRLVRRSLPALATIGLVVAAMPLSARAEEPQNAEDRRALYEALSAPRSGYKRALVGLGFGGGLRFNNPYRLATQLGQTAQSLSTTAPYMTISAGLVFGKPDGLQHGGTLGLSFALSGVDQAVLAPGYMLVFRGPSRLLAYGRGGPAIVLSPDANVGLEIAGGAAYFLTGSFGISADVAGDIFYGASTWEKKYPVYPVLSATLGVIVDLEFLP